MLPKWLRRLFGIKDAPAPQIAPQPPQPAPPTSPYIQPVPSAPAPDPAALEPVRPTPALMTSGAGNDPGFVPEPLTVDVYGRQQPGAPYGRRQDGQPFGSMGERRAWFDAVAARDANLAQAEKMTVDAVYNGPIPVSSLSDAEKQFLTYVTSNYSLPGATTQFDAWLAICSGPWIDFRRAFADGDRLTKAGYDPNSYPPNGRLRGLVDQVARGILKPRVTR